MHDFFVQQHTATKLRELATSNRFELLCETGETSIVTAWQKILSQLDERDIATAVLLDNYEAYTLLLSSEFQDWLEISSRAELGGGLLGTAFGLQFYSTAFLAAAERFEIGPSRVVYRHRTLLELAHSAQQPKW